MPLNSCFYIERPPIEGQAYAEISKPGSLIRIKASRRMGKSSLMLRLINRALALEYKVATIDFREADAAIFEHPDKFFRWLCKFTTRQLNLPLKLDDYWDESVGSKVSCTLYFEGHLLPHLNCPLVLLLNEVSRIFEYPTIAREFLPLLRFWYEQARQVTIWQQLRPVVLHSTEIYIALSLHQSPFNVGLSLQLFPFTYKQIMQLAEQYKLFPKPAEIEMLLHLTGGQPYLVQLAFYHICDRQLSLKTILESATSPHGIYGEHLQSQAIALQQRPELLKAFQLVNSVDGWFFLEPMVACQLDSMGLVRMNGVECQVSCQLYRQYFKQSQWFLGQSSEQQIARLEEENQRLQALTTIDDLTNIANRRYFDKCLREEWWRLLRERLPMSLILGDIDCFKLYNDTQGHQAGDRCLQQVASAMQATLKRAGDLVARYGGEEFAVILPNTDAVGAVQVAESLCAAIRALAIAHPATQVDSQTPAIITMSLGVASILPHTYDEPAQLIQAADEALYHSKSQGRDRVTLSSVLAFKS
ncbi:MAG: AAA-like domain-containing protein [Oculatellaceae cyanobacterium bins.114]|nr:AAA-like domain-containing protein [Oculatellaceae cyanobacterium bins.114]